MSKIFKTNFKLFVLTLLLSIIFINPTFASAENNSNAQEVNQYEQTLNDISNYQSTSQNVYSKSFGVENPLLKSMSTNSTSDSMRETEPNNFEYQANTIPLNTFVYGSFNIYYDVDYFKINITTPGKLQIIGTCKSYLINHLVIGLKNSNEELIATSVLDGNCQVITKNVNPGTYYIVFLGDLTGLLEYETYAFKAYFDSNEPTNIPVTGVLLDKDNLTLSITDTPQTLTYTISPSNATNKSVTWLSSNTSIATVDQNGKVTPKSKGTTTITIKTEDGEYIDSCLVTINEPESIISINKRNLTLDIGQSETLIANILPITNKSVVWDSSNPSIAKVDKNGKVTAISEGTAIITVTLSEDTTPPVITISSLINEDTNSCTVTVKPSSIPVSAITLNKDNINLNVGDSTQELIAEVSPNNATNKNIIWSSNNEDIVIIDQDGMITGKSKGTAIIIVKSEDGVYSDYCIVNVIESIIPVIDVLLNKDNLTLNINQSEQLTYVILPNNATNKNVTWSSSNPDIASVENGMITAKTKGNAIISVITENGKIDTCNVDVVEKIIDDIIYKEWPEKTNIESDKIWNIKFNMDINSANSDNIYVTDEYNIIDTKIEIDGNIIKVAPISDYESGKTYYLIIKNVIGENNKSMKENIRMKFSVKNVNNEEELEIIEVTNKNNLIN